MAKIRNFELWFPWTADSVNFKEEELGHIHNRPLAQILSTINQQGQWKCRQVYFTKKNRSYSSEHEGVENLFFPLSSRSTNPSGTLSFQALLHLATASIQYVVFFQAYGRFPFLAAKICRLRRIPYTVLVGAWYEKYTKELFSYYRNAHRFLAHTQLQLDALARLGHSKHNMEVFPIGVDTKLFSMKPADYYQVRQDYPRLLYIGRLYGFKGVLQAAQAFRTVKSHYPNATLRIIGSPGDEDTMRTLMEIIQDNQLHGSIKIESPKDNRSLVSAYQEADLFIFPSIYEGLPQVVLESMACGTPVLIVHGRAGTKEAIDSGSDSWVVDMPNLTYELLKIINDPAKLESAGRKASEKIRSTYSSERSLEQIRSWLSSF